MVSVGLKVGGRPGTDDEAVEDVARRGLDGGDGGGPPVGVDRSATTSWPARSTPMTVWPSASMRARIAPPMPRAEPVTQ